MITFNFPAPALGKLIKKLTGSRLWRGYEGQDLQTNQGPSLQPLQKPSPLPLICFQATRTGLSLPLSPQKNPIPRVINLLVPFWCMWRHRSQHPNQFSGAVHPPNYKMTYQNHVLIQDPVCTHQRLIHKVKLTILR